MSGTADATVSRQEAARRWLRRLEARENGLGEALLIVTLKGMREAGYAYGVIGDPGPVAFYQKRLDALEIPKSKPGIYAGMLRSKPATSD